MNRLIKYIFFIAILTAGMLCYAGNVLESSTDKIVQTENDITAPLDDKKTTVPEDNKTTTSKENQTSDDAKKEDKDSKLIDENANVPNLELTNDLMYDILVGSLAARTGHEITAYDKFIALAEQTKDPRVAHWAAQVASKLRHGPRTLEAVKLWSQLAPDYGKVQDYLFELLIHEGQYEEFRQAYQKRIEQAKDAEQRMVYFYRAQGLLSKIQDKKYAYNILETLLKPYEKDASAHEVLSIASLINKDVVQARKEAKRALEIDARSSYEALFVLVETATTEEERVQLLKNYIEKNPFNSSVMLRLAQLHLKNNEINASKEALLKVAQHEKGPFVGEKKDCSPKEAEKTAGGKICADDNIIEIMDVEKAWYLLGSLTYGEGQYVIAEKYFERFLKFNENKISEPLRSRQYWITTPLILSEIAYLRKQYEKSLKWLDKVKYEEEDEQVPVLVGGQKAKIYATKGQTKKAQSVIADLKKAYPSMEPKIIVEDASLYVSVYKNEKQALKVLKAGLKKFPDNKDLLYYYASLTSDMKLYSEMEAALRHLLEIDPYNAQAYNTLGYSFAQRNIHLDEAYDLIDKADKLEPNSSYIIDSLGWVFYRQNKLEDAERCLRRAKLIQYNSEIDLHLAEVLWVQGKKEEALVILHNIKKMKDKKAHAILKEMTTRLKIKLN